MAKSKWEPKVGERVRVFTWDYEDPEADGTFDGKILAINKAGMLNVQHPDVTDYWVHPRQCRRLVKRERRRVWISAGALEEHEGDPGRGFVTGWNIHFVEPSAREYLEFVEVRRGRNEAQQ